MKNKFYLLIATLLFCYSTTQAQWTAKDTLHDYCRICQSEQHMIGQPYNNSFKKELPFLLVSSAALTSGIILTITNKTKPYTETELANLNINSINSFDRSATSNWSEGAASASDYMRIGITLLPVMFLSEHHTKMDIKSLAVMSLEVFALNFGTTYIVKNITNRPRPYVYNDSLPLNIRTNKESKQSFYSGHTSHIASATFLFAKVMSDYHPDLKRGVKIGIWVFAATVPALEAFFRVKGGRHYPSDVVTGYVLGAFSGWLIPQLHRNKNYRHREKKDLINLSLVPVDKGMVVNLSLKF